MSDLAGTPFAEFREWQKYYGFTIDAAASHENHMLPRYWTPKEDGLSQSWKGERVWCNPPYSAGNLERWVAKAAKREAEIAVLLIPPNTGTHWWHRYIWDKRKRQPRPGVEIDFIEGRLQFRHPEGKAYDNNRYDSVLVEFYEL